MPVHPFSPALDRLLAPGTDWERVATGFVFTEGPLWDPADGSLIFSDIPADRMRIHVCWASTGGPHHRDVPLKDIADVVIKARPMGLVIAGLMGIAFLVSNTGLGAPMADGRPLMLAPAVFAFGLVAFGFLGMGPVTIAVDSYGPVTDNAQSVYELSLIENVQKTSRHRTTTVSASIAASGSMRRRPPPRRMARTTSVAEPRPR